MREKRSAEKILMFLAFVVLTVVGFIVIPPIIDRIASKVYKASLKKEEIDFDDMGPEIITNEEE